jgi:putative endonuclease
MTSTSAQRNALGAFGESLAARHLTQQGMVVLDRNWRCPSGEIDLVLRDLDVLVICEVKTRSSTDFGDPLEAVTEAKVARLRRLAVAWIRERGIHPRDIRIDIVGVIQPRSGAALIEHVAGVG